MPNLSFLAPYFVDGAKVMNRLFLYVAFLIFLIYVTMTMIFPYPLHPDEGLLLDQTIRLSTGQPIYRSDLSTPPYILTTTPPLYSLILLPLINLWGPTFWMGRLVAATCALLSALLLGFIVYTAQKDRFAAVTTALLFLASPYVVFWAGFQQIDLFALGLSTLALGLVLYWPRQWATISGGLLLVAASYTHPAYALTAFLALFIWLWGQARGRAWLLLSFVGGLNGIIFILLNSFTQGGFLFNVIVANLTLISMAQIGDFLQQLMPVMSVFILLTLIFFFTVHQKQTIHRLFCLYFLGAVLSIAFRTIWGSNLNINAFLSLSAAFSLIAGSLLTYLRHHPWRYGILLLLLTLQTGFMIRTTLDHYVDKFLTPSRATDWAFQYFATLIEETQGPVLTDHHLGLLAVQRKSLYFHPRQLSSPALAGNWDQTNLINDIQAQVFPLMLLTDNRSAAQNSSLWGTRGNTWTPAMREAIEMNYIPTHFMARTIIYRPRGASTISQIPPATKSLPSKTDPLTIGPGMQLHQPAHSLHPQIAVNPTDPAHIAVLLNTSTDLNCGQATCQINLRLYISQDGGGTWQAQAPFTPAREIGLQGQIAFDLAGRLYVLGIRNRAITLNRAEAATDYGMHLANQAELTKSQLGPAPTLAHDPSSGSLFIVFNAQYRDAKFITPALNRSDDGGATWSATTRVPLEIATFDLEQGHSTWLEDLQVLFGQENTLALVWTWQAEAWTWPRDVWIAQSQDGGVTFSGPRKITRTGGPIRAVSQDGMYYVLYRAAENDGQSLILATSADQGDSWTARKVQDEIPLKLDVMKGPGLGVAPDGTIDVAFYALAEEKNTPSETTACPLDLATWQVQRGQAWLDPCRYDVYYTFSRDGGQSFSQPRRLNEAPVDGAGLVLIERWPEATAYLDIASTARQAHLVWTEGQTGQGSQAVTVQIER